MKIDGEGAVIMSKALRYYANLLSKRKDKGKPRAMELAILIEQEAHIINNKPDFEEDCEKCE